ncbi:MAG: serine/threonine protein kinase, partial [Gammaproteobacteria bacterium]|nr:serine/threonine protein kinase [Gammaproteobacteria bacterium]
MDTSSPSGGSQDDLPTTVGAEIDLIPGQVLANRFVIEAALGQGGQAHVYQAHDRITDNTLAIKILGRRSELSEIAIERLRDELLVARKVSDPHVIRVHEFYRDSDFVFYTMDFIAGETLAARLQRPIDCNQAQHWIVQLTSALKACHRAEIVHGDIKPANLLINANNELILADFGISAREYAGYMQETGSGHYRAPESLAGEPATRAVDVYALGRVIQRLLAVVKPKTWSERVWYWHWQRQVKKLLSEDPLRRLGLTQLRLAPQTPSMGKAVSVGAAVLIVVLGWYLLQSARVPTHETDIPITVEAMPAVHRIAFVHTSNTAQSSQVAAIAALKFAAEPQVVLTSEARVQQLLNQLQLKPHEQSRDRQRLASLLNVEILVFLEPMLHGNEEHNYLQVYLSRHPDNQLFGVTEIELSQGPLRALEQLIEHVQQQLELTLPTDTPDLQLSASVAQVMVLVQQLYSIEQLIVTEREFISEFASEPAFWFALAQSAYELGDDTEAQR